MNHPARAAVAFVAMLFAGGCGGGAQAGATVTPAASAAPSTPSEPSKSPTPAPPAAPSAGSPGADPFAGGCATLMQAACEPGPCACSVVASEGDAALLARSTGELTRYVPALRTAAGVRLGDLSIEVLTSDTSMCKTAKNAVSNVTLKHGDAAIDVELVITFDVFSNCPETGVPIGKKMTKGNQRKEALHCAPKGEALHCEVAPTSP